MAHLNKVAERRVGHNQPQRQVQRAPPLSLRAEVAPRVRAARPVTARQAAGRQTMAARLAAEPAGSAAELAALEAPSVAPQPAEPAALAVTPLEPLVRRCPELPLARRHYRVRLSFRFSGLR